MPTTSWNDEEDAALYELPHFAVVVYLRCLRRWMDYRSGVVGEARRISYQMIAEETAVPVSPGIKSAFNASLAQVRWALEKLEERGLVERRSKERQLIFYLPKADRDKTARLEVQQRYNRAGAADLLLIENNDLNDSGNRGTTEQVQQTSGYPEKKKNTRPSGDGPAPGFETFWLAYPRREKKAEALKAWNRLRPDEALQAEIMAGLERWNRRWTDRQFIPLPPSWLNGRRWEDEIGEKEKPASGGRKRAAM